ncbi:glycosyltransferase family 4 protein [Scytonema sp. NUACC26]|uniref:glycosyltransferase family 4 protein n=1 Tax=Scytonema sp. NUACC26 TaxID=3140176 RepID=UPI0034DBF496
MHLIVLEQTPSSRLGGQQIALFDICCGLAEKGHKISLLYTQEGNLLEQYQQFCDRVFKVKRYLINRPQYVFDFLIDLWKVGKNIPFDCKTLVLSNQFHDTPFGSALASYKNVPLVCYLHLPPPRKKLATWQWNMGLRGLKKFLAFSNLGSQWSIGLKGVKHFITVSNHTKSDWVNSDYPENIIDIVYNGVDLEVYKPTNDFVKTRKEWNISEDIEVISFVGRLDRAKGVETIIKAFALLQKNFPNTRLLIAGNSVNDKEDYKKLLEQLVVDLKVEQSVKFLGHVNNTTSLYQVSDVTVLASQWSEPFGRAIIESMACSTPVVGSRIGGIPEILTGEFQNFLFEATNERDLAETLSRVINWREKDAQLGERCRHHISSKLSFEKMIDGIEKVLETVIIQHN